MRRGGLAVAMVLPLLLLALAALALIW